MHVYIRAKGSSDRFSDQTELLSEETKITGEICDGPNKANLNSPQRLLIVAQLLESFMQHCNLLK